MMHSDLPAAENSNNTTIPAACSFDGAWAKLYDELHDIAASQMTRERTGHLLQTTAIVHEAYFRLAKDRSETWKNKSTFFAAAAVVMRRVLIDAARRERAAKRGNGQPKHRLHETRIGIDDRAFRSLEVHDALEVLSGFAPDQARALELMIFGGLTGDEIASVMGVSSSTIDRRIRLAKAWLRRELAED